MGMDITQEESTFKSTLLELAASDDLKSFKFGVESLGMSIDDLGLWYTRRIGSNKMAYEQRTPLMVAAQYGSVNVVDYIIQFGNSVDVNRVAGSDRVTALHCAVAGGSHSSASVIHRLISASANLNLLDANGNRASDLISMLPKLPSKSSKQIDTLLKSGYSDSDSSSISGSISDSDSDSKKEFAVSELPDINNGVYGSDEFRMYCFKIKPCSRAYTHDWTECPFAHPGENARRRDPKKYQYTCVPCPEFKKGSCKKGDECEFAHGVFESWLHPAQYRTRLCKDEIGCARKVCFFAHRKDELRPVYASTGSALPDTVTVSSPNSSGFTSTSTPPMSPSFAPLSPSSGASAGAGGMYQGKSNFGITPPNLQLPGSRLRSSLSARDVGFERELIKIETQLLNQQQQYQQHHHQHQHQHQQVLSPRPSPRWNNNNLGRMSDMIPATNLETAFASINVSRKMSPPNVLDSPLSAPRKLSPPRAALDSPKSVAAAMLNSRAAAFAKRSQSFIDRAGSPVGGNLSSPSSTNMSDWGSPNGKLDWGIHGQELNKLRKSNSFGFRGANNNATRTSPPGFNEPDVSWVNSLVKDEAGAGFLGSKAANHGRGGAGNGVQVQDMCSPWEQLYIEEQLVV